jgi:outer membrane biosynthesis protein TonB
VVPAHQSGGHPPARIHAVIISLAPEQRPVAPPAPVKPPEQQQPLVPVPTPIPMPVPKPKPAAPPKLKPKPAASTAPPTPPKPQISPEVQEMDDVVGRIHENWLEPPSAAKSFHCRVHIDYAIGGMITAVNIVQDCGSTVLDDSVRRAVWKTQPLPLLRAKLAAGSIDIDFLP